MDDNFFAGVTPMLAGKAMGLAIDMLSSTLKLRLADRRTADRRRVAKRRARARRPAKPTPFFNHDELHKMKARVGLYVVAGAPRGGKDCVASVLAYNWAPAFTYGCVSVDLDKFRGPDGTLSTFNLFGSILRGLGIADDDLADSPEARDDQYREVTAKRHFMLKARHVRGQSELALLRPESPANLTLATVDKLDPAIRAEVQLDDIYEVKPLKDQPARQLLASRCGMPVLADEPDATARLLKFCGGHPSALIWAGAGLASARRGGRGGVRDFIESLPRNVTTDPDSVLTEAVRRHLEELSPSDRTTVLFIAAHPQVHITPDSATAVTGRVITSVDLGRLRDAYILTEDIDKRLTMPEFVYDYVKSVATAEGLPLNQGFQRLVTTFVTLAVSVDRARDPDRLRVYPESHPLGSNANFDAPAAEQVIHDNLDLIDALTVEAAHGEHMGRYDIEVCVLAGALELFATSRNLFTWYQAINCCRVTCANRLRPTSARPDHEIEKNEMRLRAYQMHGRMHTLLYQFDDAQAALNTAWRLLLDVERTRGATAGICRKLRSSLLEFQSRLLEMQAELTGQPDYSAAIDCLRQALAIDQQPGTYWRRSKAIHLRMLANITWKQACAGDETLHAEARRLAEEAVGLNEGRNLGRAHMVRAKVYTETDASLAADAYNAARAILGRADAGPYERELREIAAHIASAAGRPATARRLWSELATDAAEDGHPSLSRYLRELDQLPHKRNPFSRIHIK